MALLKSFKYHFFGVTGFVLYVFTTLTLEKLTYFLTRLPAERQPFALQYYVSEGVICGLLAYVLSNILLYYIEKYVDFAQVKRRSLYSLAGVFAGVLLLYHLCLWPVLSWVHNYFMGEEITVPLVIKVTNLPFFATIFLIWFFIIVTIKVFRYINQVKITRLELESNLRESQLNTLKGQINPHFMFNSLNNIRGLILEDATRARDIITRLSEMLRYSLTKNGVNTIPLKEELQTVDNYIEISKIQFEERLQFSIAVNPEAINIAIPPMIIQMLVENAVKHGVGKLKQGGQVNLTVDIISSNLIITVSNSGQLNLEEGSTRLGLENIRKRLGLIFADRASFSLVENNNFVEATISIPL
jgi:two-component system LytT family sensor kinase